MVAPWVTDEMKTVDLKDQRLNKRLGEVLDHLAARPTASIPAASGGYAETAAAYRLFDNDKVSFENVLAPHVEATRQRMAEQPIVLLTQDTTEIDLTRPEQQVAGAGPLDNSRRGALLHLMHGFTPDGTPLGTIHAVPWMRDDEQPTNSSELHPGRKQLPIEEKESHRWLVAMQQARAEARRLPATQVICVADSEADVYEVFVEGQAEPREAEWIVRACQNRVLQQNDQGQDACAQQHLRKQLLAAPVLFKQTINVRGRKPKVACDERRRRQPRISRTAEVEVRAARVALRPPWRPDRDLPPIWVNAVLVLEINPPQGEEPVEWLLLTSLPIDSVEQVRQVLQYYTTRWMVEVFFRTLKSGCRVEQRRFEDIERVLPCLAVYLIVTWRTLYVCRLGRACPQISCEAVFEPAEWKAVYQVVHRQPPPSQPPPLAEMVRMVAQLGGYINRKRNDPPGPQTVWLGLQRMHDMALCWQLFRPAAATES